jgi:hypothetical protein
MSFDLSPAAARALAIGLLLLLLAGIGVSFAAGAVAIRDADDTAAGLRQELALLARLSMTRDRLEERRAALVAAAGGATPALQGASPAIAAASLQQLVGSIVAAHAGRVDSTLVLPAIEDPGYTRIGLRASFSARIGALRDILYAFEAGAPPLFIPAFTIRADTAEGNSEDPDLTVSVDLYGVMRRSAEGS